MYALNGRIPFRVFCFGRLGRIWKDAINGIYLTVTLLRADSFTADVMAETVRRSSLKDLRTGDEVNLLGHME